MNKRLTAGIMAVFCLPSLYSVEIRFQNDYDRSLLVKVYVADGGMSIHNIQSGEMQLLTTDNVQLTKIEVKYNTPTNGYSQPWVLSSHYIEQLGIPTQDEHTVLVRILGAGQCTITINNTQPTFVQLRSLVQPGG